MRERTFNRTRDGETLDSEEQEGLGLGGLLRSLIKGIPFCEAAERVETLHLPCPSSSAVTIHNANGRTRLVGEDRASPRRG